MQITEEFVKTRLDVFVSSYMSITRSSAQNLIDEGNVTVNGKVESKNYKLRSGDNVEIEESEPKILDVTSENISYTLKPHKVFLFNSETEERIYFEVK